MLGYNVISKDNYRRFGVYCLQIGQQLQYLQVFTALYPIILESLTPHLIINRRFKITKHQLKD
jgi:hypothetical protein